MIFRKSATLQDVTPELETASIGISPIGTDLTPTSPGISKKVQLVRYELCFERFFTYRHHLQPRERVIDMSAEDQKTWEMEEMAKPIDLDEANIHIDPAPFQLVEKTSILKVHSLFSMIGINHAYVTKIGRLVGVVGLKEVIF